MQGRGPTRLISPRTTLMSWGSSSNPVARSRAPSRMSRGSFRASNLVMGTSLSINRSEERRGGKECRSRWSPHHSKKTRAALRLDLRVEQVADDLLDARGVLRRGFLFFQAEDGIRDA